MPDGGAPAPAREAYRAIVVPLAVFYLALGAAVRVCLWAAFGDDAGFTLADLGVGLGLGVVNDLCTLVYLLLPLMLLLLLAPASLLRSRAGRPLLATVLYVCVFAALFVAVAEIMFFDEFESRFNLVAVDYLIYPTEVVGNLEESYPIPALLAGVAIAALVLWVPLWRRARSALASQPPGKLRFGIVAANGLAACALVFFVSAESLALSSHRATNELAMNGVATFFRAFRTEEIDYHEFYPVLPRTEAFAIMRQHLGRMGGTFTSSDPESLTRSFAAKPSGLGKLNVVVISEESLGAQFVGTYGDTRGLTPVFDELARSGLVFADAYATGTRTVRGLEAMSASFPPIPSEAIVKRDGGEHVSNWGNVMRESGYHVSFLYGGFGAFDNMNAYFGGNGFALSDRLDIVSPKFTNIWGVSDEDLFHHAIGYFDEVASKGGPFFTLIMTTSNHKPFTFPPGAPGVPEQGGGRNAGVRYADYAIGRFFAEARGRPWFDHTLFVVIADHDSRVYGRAEVPVEHYRIPVLFYAPGRLAAGVSHKTFSNMDLAPTVLGLLGLPYSAPFYGADVLDPAVPDRRPVLFSHNHEVAIYQGDKLSVVGLRRAEESYLYENGQSTPAPLDRTEIDLLTAYLQTAYELFQEHRY